MITYEKFWETLEKKGISQYRLVKDYGISPSLLDRLKHNRSVTTQTLNKLCFVLDCALTDIITFYFDYDEFPNLIQLGWRTYYEKVLKNEHTFKLSKKTDL